MSPGAQAHSDLVAFCLDYLRSQGAWVLKVAGGLGIRRGTADILAGLRPAPAARYAILIGIEAKTGTGRLSQAQRREQESMARAGVLYIVVRCPEDLERALVDAGLVRPILRPRPGDAHEV